MTTAVIAVVGVATLFALFGVVQRSAWRRDVPSCACFGGEGNCATCPREPDENGG
jgi:hypothetical protein